MSYMVGNPEDRFSRDKAHMALCQELPLGPYIVLANSEGSGDTARMRKLA